MDTYKFQSYNERGYAVIEATHSFDDYIYTLRVPMQPKHHQEVSYILDTEDWEDWETDTYQYSKIFDSYEEFVAGNTPMLVSWWVSLLPNTTTHWNMRRRKWTLKLRQLLSRLLNR